MFLIAFRCFLQLKPRRQLPSAASFIRLGVHPVLTTREQQEDTTREQQRNAQLPATASFHPTCVRTHVGPNGLSLSSWVGGLPAILVAAHTASCTVLLHRLGWHKMTIARSANLSSNTKPLRLGPKWLRTQAGNRLNQNGYNMHA